MKSIFTVIFFVFLVLSCKPDKPLQISAVNTAPIDTTNQKKITFSTSADKNSLIFIQVYQLYSAIFNRLGYSFNAETYPTERALILANNGQTDGEGGRIILIDTAIYRNLLKANETVANIKMAAYSKNANIKVSGWKSFEKYNNLIIGYIHGSTETSREIEDFVPASKLVEITSTQQGCAMLAANRIDIFIDVYEFMEYSLNSNPSLKNSGINCSGIIKAYSVYPYFNKSKKELLPKFDSILFAMKQNGEYKTIMTNAFNEFVKANNVN